MSAHGPSSLHRFTEPYGLDVPIYDRRTWDEVEKAAELIRQTPIPPKNREKH